MSRESTKNKDIFYTYDVDMIYIAVIIVYSFFVAFGDHQ